MADIGRNSQNHLSSLSTEFAERLERPDGNYADLDKRGRQCRVVQNANVTDRQKLPVDVKLGAEEWEFRRLRHGNPSVIFAKIENEEKEFGNTHLR